MMAVRRIEAAVLALGVLGAAWLASDRILWPFIAAGIVVGVALMAAYRFVWYKPSGQPNRYRNLALLIGAAGGTILSAILQAAPWRKRCPGSRDVRRRLLCRWPGGRRDQTLGGRPTQASEVTKVRRR